MDGHQNASISGNLAGDVSSGKQQQQAQHISSSCTNSRCSSNSSSSPNISNSSSTTSSLPQYSEDIRQAATAMAATTTTSLAPQLAAAGAAAPSSQALDLLQRQSSISSSTKTCEVDLGDEERDTFSPISSSCSSSHNSPLNPDGIEDVGCIGKSTNDAIYNGATTSNTNVSLIDNKIYDDSIQQSNVLPQTSSASALASASVSTPATATAFKIKLNHNGGSNNSLHHSTTKEEKQRQNEEIVIMETSSISSETGSWESVYPHTSTVAIALVPTTTTITSSNAEHLGSCTITDTTLHNTDCKVKKQFPQFPHMPPQLPLHTAENSQTLRDNNSNTIGNSYRTNDIIVGLLSPNLRERTCSNSAAITADTSSLFTGGSTSLSLPTEIEKPENTSSMTGSTACFIDASSLCDEDEVLSFPSLDGQHSNDDGLVENHHEKIIETTKSASKGIMITDDAVDGDDGGDDDDVECDNDDESPTKKLETFHKSFAKCKVKTKESNPNLAIAAAATSASSSSVGSPEKIISTASPTSVNNLSDEEKLWKRELDIRTKVIQTPLDNGFDREKERDREVQQHLSAHEDVTEASVSLVADCDSSDSSDIVKLRREQERNKHSSNSGSGPPYIFHHNLQQFSIHPLGVSPKFPIHSASGSINQHAGNGDLSYTTDYSSSSPAPSIVWSENDCRPSNAGNGGTLYDTHLQKPCLLPDTPHNSIVHIDAGSSSNASSIHRDCTPSSSFSHQRDSGAYCSDATDSPMPMPIPLPRTPKRSKFDEVNPIVSGGVSIKDFSVKQCESPPIKRRTETCPIVSGGFVSLDFERTDPIADENEENDEEGGEVEVPTKLKNRKPPSGIVSWVVDMSDCRGERRKSTSSSSSLDITGGPKVRERSDSNSSHKSGCGFYVSLDDMDRKPMQQKNPMSKSYTTAKSTGFFVNLSKSEYSENVENIATKSPPVNEANQTKSEEPSDSRKNIFSMFIDIGEKKRQQQQRKKEPLNLASRLSSSLTTTTPTIAQQRKSDETMKSSTSSTETLMSRSSNFKSLPSSDLFVAHDPVSNCESKSLDYRCNVEPPLTIAAIRRISQQQQQQQLQQRAQKDVTKRHSWGNNVNNSTNNNFCNNSNDSASGHDCKRSISFTVNSGGGCNDLKDSNGSGLMSIIDKIPLIAKASSLSVDSSLSPYDEYTGSKSELTSTSSNNSARNSMSGGERDDDLAPKPPIKMRKHRRDVQINETFDKSSLASITDGVLSKDLSPASTTDTDDLTFQQDEELALREAVALHHQHDQIGQAQSQPQSTLLLSTSSNRSSAIIMETIIEAREISSPKKNASGHTMETLHATIEKQQKMLLETVNEHGETTTVTAGKGGGGEKGNFVKLSDMDKPIKLIELRSPETMMSKSVGNHRQINRLFRDETTKARPHSWTMTRSTGTGATANSLLNITNSVDNLRSLSRLFPNFSKEFSNSLPNDITLDHGSSVHMDYIQTDISADSSLASSFSRSGMDESSISCRQPRRLGEDLLKMFLQEIATDMIVEVHGRRIKAHKCILRSRCQYFAAMLAGNGTQSVVSLQGYSYSAVHFALCHIYSGASHPPDGISLMELAALADLLGLEGLKEVTAHALKTNYCHNFHKPCSGCIEGILQVLPVALNHALDDLYRKCLRWTCRHYLKVWPTRQFAQLPPDILGRCRQQIVAYMTPETVLDTVLDCDNLLTQLSAFRWGAICENLVRDILDAAYVYIGDHFASLIASDAFLSLGHDRSCHIPHLEGVLLRTASSLTADQACRSYQRVTRLNTVLQAKVLQMPANLGELAKELQGLQEEDLDWDKEYIRLVSAVLSAVEQCLIRQCSRAMRVTAWQRMDLDLRKKIQTLARLTEPVDVKRNSKPVSKAFSFGGSTRNQDLYQVKLAIQAHSKRSLAQDTQLYKATQTHEAGNVQTADRGVQANHDLREGNGKILKSNSRAHVPQSNNYKSGIVLQSTVVVGNERNSLHKRAFSDGSAGVGVGSGSETKQKIWNDPKTDSSVTKPQTQLQPHLQQIEKQQNKTANRLADVRPRYLEPRKSRNLTAIGPVRSQTSSSIPATTITNHGKGRQISSSDSSRNSSPAINAGATAAPASKAAAATRKANVLNVKIGTKSTNMSLDSLASPSRRGRSVMLNTERRAQRGKSSDTERYSDVGVDVSLGESMKSSMLTNKTISQESLKGGTKLSRSNPLLLSSNKNSNYLNANDGKNLNGSGCASSKKTKGLIGNVSLKHNHHHNINSTLSSPSSSINTTKSASAASRISSVSSTQSTRNNVYKHRSISVPAGQQDNNNSNMTAGQSNQRRSFLSAKSREILARRAEKNKKMQLELEKQQQQQQPQQQQQQHKNINITSDDKISSSSSSHSQNAVPLRSASQTAITTIANRHSLPSNIPTRRPNTLQLKKTNGINSMKNLSNINTKSTNNSIKLARPHIPTTTATIKQNFELIIDNSFDFEQKIKKSESSTPPSYDQKNQNAADVQPLHIDSKLERSSTFCKDNSDLDLSELQIIE